MVTELDSEEYQDALDEALMAYADGDESLLLDHFREYDQEHLLPRGWIARKAMILKMITSRTQLPQDVRSDARVWLEQNHFDSNDGEDDE